jgi:hypothetical protein
LLFIYGGLNFWLYVKFTPVYTAITCGDERAVMDRFELEQIRIGMQITVTCMNPNPYGIKILASSPGRVFVHINGRNKTQIGQLAVVPGSSLPEDGSGAIRVRMDTHLSGPDADKLLPHFLYDTEVPILMELRFDVGVYIPIGVALGNWAMSAPMEKACGLNMAGILVNRFVSASAGKRGDSRLGPLICRESFNGMHIPPIGEESETPEDGRMGFSAKQVAPREVAKGEMMKNVSLGVIISLCFLTGCYLTCGWAFGRALASLRSADTSDARFDGDTRQALRCTATIPADAGAYGEPLARWPPWMTYREAPVVFADSPKYQQDPDGFGMFSFAGAALRWVGATQASDKSKGSSRMQSPAKRLRCSSPLSPNSTAPRPSPARTASPALSLGLSSPTKADRRRGSASPAIDEDIAVEATRSDRAWQTREDATPSALECSRHEALAMPALVSREEVV